MFIPVGHVQRCVSAIMIIVKHITKKLDFTSSQNSAEFTVELRSSKEIVYCEVGKMYKTTLV